MHQGNREWLDHCQARYGSDWVENGILEIGSLDINGSARSYLKTKRHVGIDVVEGPGVDIVCSADKTWFEGDEYFDCLLCTSVLEHAPNWRELLDHNLRWIRADGLLLLSWGAEGNQHHAPEPWAPVPLDDVLEHLYKRFTIYEAYWESIWFTPDCQGCFDLVARLRPA